MPHPWADCRRSYVNKSSLTRHDLHNNAGILVKPETDLFLLILGYCDG